MIQVSVCIPVYNMRQYLMSCINSVVAAAQGIGDKKLQDKDKVAGRKILLESFSK